MEDQVTGKVKLNLRFSKLLVHEQQTFAKTNVYKVNLAKDGTLIEWRSNVTRNITTQFLSKADWSSCWTIDTKVGKVSMSKNGLVENLELKALHLGRAFKMHIETLRFLFDQIPELTCLQQQSRQV